MQFFAGSLIVTLFFIYRDCGRHQDWFREAVDCTDASMGGYLLGYQQFFGKMVVDVVTGGFMACGLVLLDLVYFVWRKWKGDLEKDSKERKKIHSDEVSDWSVSKIRNAG